MPLHEKYDESRKGLWFSIMIDNEEFVAFVSGDALNEHFHASKNPGSQLIAYRENKQRIDSIAHQKFITGSPRPIKLLPADFKASNQQFAAASVSN